VIREGDASVIVVDEDRAGGERVAERSEQSSNVVLIRMSKGGPQRGDGGQP